MEIREEPSFLFAFACTCKSKSWKEEQETTAVSWGGGGAGGETDGDFILRPSVAIFPLFVSFFIWKQL